ncbi:MAG: PadR family transcriptional regulator [Gemmatimonadetes bacterium]|nr:PadR family transcriptional regulator [Gemmatimonadota bacterium]
MSRSLKSQWFQILLALADQERHGYGIQRDVLDRTDGQMMLWPATLYRSLAALVERGLIAAVTDPGGGPPDERRQYYRITPVGRGRLDEEAERLTRWAEIARERNDLGTARSV